MEKKKIKSGKTIDFSEALFEDDTGIIPLKLWANFATMFKNGDCLLIEDVFSYTFNGESYITTGIRENLKKI